MPIVIKHPEPPPPTVGRDNVQYGKLYRIATTGRPSLAGKLCVYNGDHFVVFFDDAFKDTNFKVVGSDDAKLWTFEPLNPPRSGPETSVVIT